MMTINETLSGAITVGMLIEQLQGLDPDSPVIFSCDYGDRCHTQQALLVATVDERPISDIQESAYSNSGLAVRELDDEDYDKESVDEDGDDMLVVVLASN